MRGVAKGFLADFGVQVFSHVVQIGSVRAETGDDLGPADFASVDESPVRCLDDAASDAMVEEINTSRKANESLGGVFEVRAYGLVPGIGSYVSWEGRMDGRLGAGDHVDPGDEGRERRRRVRRRRAGRIGGA